MLNSSIEALIACLNDAQIMEEASISLMEAQVRDLGAYPAIQQRVQQHIGQTRGHLELIRQRIKKLNGVVAPAMSPVGVLEGTLSGIATSVDRDRAVKSLLNNYAAEQFEIACYRALISAAKVLDDTETESLAERILGEEQEAAAFLSGQLPFVVEATLHEETVRDLGRA